jgi:selenocysteine-specific elongation factor
VLRQLAPPDTVGGGVVIDAAPRKHGASDAVVERLRRLERGEDVPEERRARARAAEPSPPPRVAEAEIDDAALRLAALLRSDGREPRTDSDLAAAAGLTPSEASERLRQLVRAGTAVRVGPNLHFHAAALAELRAEVVAICGREGQTTIGGVRDALGTSRKYAQAVLEHLDAEKVTLRRGDVHVLRG